MTKTNDTINPSHYWGFDGKRGTGMTREERFKMDMMDEFKQMCEIVEKDGRIIENKQRMLKVLEQEPFMNKPCVANQVCREDKVKVLDKIRDEIIQIPTISFNANDIYKADVLAIIDKYKADKEQT